MAAPSGNLIGQVLGGRYRLVAILGHGGVGTVYEAMQEDLGRKVAVKVLHLTLAGDPSWVRRMEREARSTAALEHPNIVQITDFQVTPGGLPYLVMERLAGRPLREVIEREAPLAPGRVGSIATQCLSALEVAHKAGIIHRDVKPENLFVIATPAMPDFVKVLDFGIAKASEEALIEGATGLPALTSMTQTGAVLGTYGYMPPEQSRGESVDARADLFAVGACMYEALVGRQASSDALTSGARLPTGGPIGPVSVDGVRAGASLRERRPDLDPRLTAIVTRALEQDRERRFANAGEMLAALAAVGSGPGITITPPHAPSAEELAPTDAGMLPLGTVRDAERERPPETERFQSPQRLPSSPPTKLSPGGSRTSAGGPASGPTVPASGPTVPASPSGAVLVGASGPPPVARTPRAAPGTSAWPAHAVGHGQSPQPAPYRRPPSSNAPWFIGGGLVGFFLLLGTCGVGSVIVIAARSRASTNEGAPKPPTTPVPTPVTMPVPAPAETLTAPTAPTSARSARPRPDGGRPAPHPPGPGPAPAPSPSPTPADDEPWKHPPPLESSSATVVKFLDVSDPLLRQGLEGFVRDKAGPITHRCFSTIGFGYQAGKAVSNDVQFTVHSDGTVNSFTTWVSNSAERQMDCIEPALRQTRASGLCNRTSPSSCTLVVKFAGKYR